MRQIDVDVHLYICFQNVNVVTHQEWMPSGPDAAPIDFAICEILIKGFHKRTKPTIW